MTGEQTALTNLVTDMRAAFDQTFAAPLADTSKDTHSFLAIRVGGDYYALRLMEISGLFADKKVVPLPSRSPDLLGIASFRGTVVPVYDLRILLGYPAASWPRWLVLIAPEAAVGLAFDHLDGYLDLPREAIAREAGTKPVRQHVEETLHDDHIIRSIIRTASILGVIKQREQSSVTRAE